MQVAAKRSMMGAVIVAGALAAGCGGSSEPKQPVKAAAATKPDRKAEARKAADERLAKAANLKLADLPNGWQAKDDDHEDSVKCEQGEQDRTGGERSPDFSKGQQENALGAVHVYANDATASRALARFTTADNRECVRKAMDDLLRQERTQAEVTTGEVAGAPLGDERRGTRMEVAIEGTRESAGIGVTVTIDVSYVRVGRAVAMVMTGEGFADLEGLHEQLTGKVARRLERATV